jgi:hypothetical protein
MTTDERRPPLVFGQLDATIRFEGTSHTDGQLICDHCRTTIAPIEGGMSLDDLLMAYALHQHAPDHSRPV